MIPCQKPLALDCATPAQSTYDQCLCCETQPVHMLNYALPKAACARLRDTCSIHLLDRRATRASTRRGGAAAWHAAHVWHAAAACCLVHLHHDRVHDALDLLLLRLELVLLSELVLVEPVQSLLHGLLNLFLVAVLELVLELLLVQRAPHREAIVLQAVLRLDFLLVGLVLCPVLFCLAHHAVDLRLRQPALLVRDRDLVRLARRLVLSRDVQDAIGVDVKGHLHLWDASGSGRDTVEMKFAEKIVVLRHGALAFEHLNQNARRSRRTPTTS